MGKLFFKIHKTKAVRKAEGGEQCNWNKIGYKIINFWNNDGYMWLIILLPIFCF